MANSRTITLIGFQDQGNLGIGYLAAMLSEHGYRVDVLDFCLGQAEIQHAIDAARPMLVGFSLIFQFYLPQFADLAAHLRRHGVKAHFTMGGHYPSLRYDEVLDAVPELDSIGRFECEETLLELVDRLSEGSDWRQTNGIAYRQDGHNVAAPVRPLVADLDRLPYPRRPPTPEHVLGRRATPMLATRGCPRTCCFCSIIEFYRQVPGRAVRRREPERVVREMKHLFDRDGIRIFLFQDDDFPLIGKAGRRWVSAFIQALEQTGLYGEVIWKISCRADEIDPGLFAQMRDAGLYIAYLGLESGTDEGLQALSKRTTVADNLRAVATLKSLNILPEFGFMLFDPSSSFDSVRANVEFLRRIVGDGSGAAAFCKMLPYASTPIERELAAAGRLRGDVVRPDYTFLDSRLDGYYQALQPLVAPWIQGPDALSPRLNWAWNEIAVIERLFPPLAGLADYRRRLRGLTRSSNERLFDLVQESSVEFESNRRIKAQAEGSASFCADAGRELLGTRDAFIFAHQDRLLSALEKSHPAPRVSAQEPGGSSDAREPAAI